MWDEKSLGYDDFLYSDVKNNQDTYFRQWNRGNRRPVVTANYEDKDALFDPYFYERGGAVLHMLRKTLGEENWWRAINHYLTKNAHQPVETEQLRIAIEEATGQSMDWFFDEWLYRMGHPVFRVTKNYDPTAKSLTLTVKQEQKPDATSAYPQTSLFQMPVEIEIGTANNTRIEKVRIEPKEEQTFTFRVDAEPLLVNFDYQDTLIKELKFEKPTNELYYQLSKDQDVLGRIWALDQLSSRIKDKATADADRQPMASALATALTSDKFWAVRLESASALNGVDTKEARTALIAAAKDSNARVRARALTSLGAFKDPSLATVFQEHLNDPSYATIRAASAGLGAGKSPGAYDALAKLLDTTSWHDVIRAAGLNGLAALGDKRALDVGLKYAAKENRANVRGAALTLVGTLGKDDPRSFQLLSDAFTKAVESGNFQLALPTATALVMLGDPRGAQLMEDAAGKTEIPQLKRVLVQLADRLKKSSQTVGTKPGP
jgi:aminopeptidase N